MSAKTWIDIGFPPDTNAFVARAGLTKIERADFKWDFDPAALMQDPHAEGSPSSIMQRYTAAMQDMTMSLQRAFAVPRDMLLGRPLEGELLVVLRLENRQGEGPYDSGLASELLQERREARRLNPDGSKRRDPHPHPRYPDRDHEELQFSRDEHHFGFLTPRQLVRWFDRRTRRELEHRHPGRFFIAAYLAEAGYVRGATSQCVFKKGRSRLAGRVALACTPSDFRELFVRSWRKALSSGAVATICKNELEELPL